MNFAQSERVNFVSTLPDSKKYYKCYRICCHSLVSWLCRLYKVRVRRHWTFQGRKNDLIGLCLWAIKSEGISAKYGLYTHNCSSRRRVRIPGRKMKWKFALSLPVQNFEINKPVEDLSFSVTHFTSSSLVHTPGCSPSPPPLPFPSCHHNLLSSFSLPSVFRGRGGSSGLTALSSYDGSSEVVITAPHSTLIPSNDSYTTCCKNINPTSSYGFR